MPNNPDMIRALEETTPVEHRQRVIRGIVAQIPVIGSIITEYLPDKKVEKLTEFVTKLSQDIEQLREQIDEEYVKREEILGLVDNTFRMVTETYDANKIIALKNGLIRTMLRKDINIERKEYYFNILKSLTAFHFRILHLLYFTDDYFSNAGIRLSTTVTSGRIYFLKEALPDMSEDEIKLTITDLKTKGLISDIGITGLQTTSGTDALRGFQSSFGSEFMNFFAKLQ